VNSTPVDFEKFVTDHEGSKAEAFDFGEMYIGSEKILSAFLNNNTPK
jgi:hypothetical protein